MTLRKILADPGSPALDKTGDDVLRDEQQGRHLSGRRLPDISSARAGRRSGKGLSKDGIPASRLVSQTTQPGVPWRRAGESSKPKEQIGLSEVMELQGWEVESSLCAAAGELVLRKLSISSAARDDEASSAATPRSPLSAGSSSCNAESTDGHASGANESPESDRHSHRTSSSPSHAEPSSPHMRAAHPVMPDCLRQLCEEARDMFMEVSGEAADEETEDAEPGDTDLREHFTTYMRPPGFAGVEPTIAFSADVSSFSREGLQPVKKKIWVRFGGIANSPVKNALKLAGIRRTAKGTHFNLFWTAALSRDSAWWKVLNKYQRVNHFPGTWELGRKDKLYKNVAHMRRAKGAEFDFVPRFFILPREMEEYQQDIERNPTAMYIQKPLASSRGRGIRMVVKPKEMPKDVHCLVQRYIANPLTINGYKFDIRLYCVVTCFDPLKVYLFDDGLVRFATEKYSNSACTLKKRCMHLTNYSVNKKKEAFVDAKEGEDGVGFKWSFDPLKKHLEERGTPWSAVWDQMRAIVAKTIIAVEPKINTLVKMVAPHRNVCFEIYGFDIMLDSNMKAWLIEVNTGPSLGATAPIDRKVKYPVVADMLNLVGLVPYDRLAYEREEEERRQARLTGLGEKESRVRHRDVREAQEMEFTGVLPDELPEVIREAEAEYGRRGRYHRVFPVPEDPCRYLDLFDAPRYDTTIVCRYLEQKAAGLFNGDGSAAMKRIPSRHRIMSARPDKSTWNSPTATRNPSSGSLEARTLSSSSFSSGGSSFTSSATLGTPSRPRPSSVTRAQALGLSTASGSNNTTALPPARSRSNSRTGSSVPLSQPASVTGGSARHSRAPSRVTAGSGASPPRKAMSTKLRGGQTSPKNGRR